LCIITVMTVIPSLTPGLWRTPVDHSLSAPVAFEATQPGALAGFSVSCSCGFEARTSLSAMFANMDAVAHVNYMKRKEG
jgi:hypothetical protein